MRLTIVGCSGSYPGPDSPASCYLVEHDGHRIVLDMGNGSFGALQRYADVYDIDAVVLSHLHADHCLDVTSYYVARRYHPAGPKPQMPVLGPTGTADRMARGYDMPTDPGMHAEFEFRDHLPVTEVGPFTIRTAPANHPVEAYGIRVEAGGSSLVFSGDTGATDELVRLGRDADLALFEASWLSRPDNPPDLHMSAAEAADHATRAGIGRLVLTHLVPWYDKQLSFAEADAVYDGELSLAAPGAVHEL
jgi:ribonuclease BN (tRNA processing enzyme)